MSHVTTAEVIADPTSYGISFPVSKLHKGIGTERVELPSCPILTVTDFGTFEKNFPGVLLKHSNGQSIRVHAQSIARNMVWANRSISHAEIITAEIDGILFGRAVTVATKVVANISDTQFAYIMSECVDNGMDSATIRTILDAARKL